MKSAIRKIIVITLVTLLLASFLNILLPHAKAAGTIIVPDDFSTIQAALTNATSDTTIYVKSGFYVEDVSIPVGLGYINIVGENKLDTVLNGSFTATFAGGPILVTHLTINGPVYIDNRAYDPNFNFRLSDCVVNSNIDLSNYNGDTIENNVIVGSLTLFSSYHSSPSRIVVGNNTFLAGIARAGIIINSAGAVGGGGCYNNVITDNTIINASVGITEEGQDIATGPIAGTIQLVEILS